MHPSLKNVFLKLENDRQQLFERLRSFDEALLCKRTKPNKWSVLEIVSHLYTAERLSVNYLRKKSLGIDTFHDSGWLEDIKFVGLVISQRLPLKFKAPKSVVEHTPAGLSLKEIESSWHDVRKELERFLDGFEEKHLRKMIYKHPRAGMLDVRHGVKFLREHFIHHKPQLEVRLKKLRKQIIAPDQLFP